jgi:hypothetical protein
MSVIVEGFVADDLSNMSQGLGVFAGIEGQRRSVKLFLNTTWGSLGLRSALSFANIEIELNALVQLLFVRVVREHRAEQIGGLLKLVRL